MRPIPIPLLLTLPLLGVMTAASAADAPSLRIVTVGYPNAEAYRRNIEVALQACQLEKKLPLNSAGVPSVATLAQFKVQETEHLLDGPLAATYETPHEVMPDPSQGCRPRVVHHFDVKVDKTCAWRLYGHSGLIGTEGPGTPAPLKEEPSGVRACQTEPKNRPATVAAEAKAPRTDAGFGQKCFWDSHVLEIMLDKPPTGPGEGACLLADLPTYPTTTYQGSRRRVSLMHHLNDTTRGGIRFSEAFGATAGFSDATLAIFEKGVKIPAERFARKGAEAYLAQPRWSDL